jgi:mono/diheme cytochrome c family protein
VKQPVLIALSLVASLVASCDAGTEDARDVSSNRVVMRPHVPVPPGTVPRGASAYAAALAPPGPPATPGLLARGRERFIVFCSPCHGASGTGDGIVVDRGFPRPPGYHQERQRDLPPEHIVSVITNGVGTMYPFAERIPPEDRWAIAHYVKALQAEGAPVLPQAPLP